MGLTNIVVGFIYKLPLPVESEKVIGTIALNEIESHRRYI